MCEFSICDGVRAPLWYCYCCHFPSLSPALFHIFSYIFTIFFFSHRVVLEDSRARPLLSSSCLLLLKLCSLQYSSVTLDKQRLNNLKISTQNATVWSSPHIMLLTLDHYLLRKGLFSVYFVITPPLPQSNLLGFW